MRLGHRTGTEMWADHSQELQVASGMNHLFKSSADPRHLSSLPRASLQPKSNHGFNKRQYSHIRSVFFAPQRYGSHLLGQRRCPSIQGWRQHHRLASRRAILRSPGTRLLSALNGSSGTHASSISQAGQPLRHLQSSCGLSNARSRVVRIQMHTGTCHGSGPSIERCILSRLRLQSGFVGS